MTLFFMNETIVRKEYSGDSTSNGWTSNTYLANANIEAGIQPFNGFQLEKLPENRRDKEQKKIYTETQMQLQDILIIDGNEFEVWATFDYTREGFLEHYKCYAERIDG